MGESVNEYLDSRGGEIESTGSFTLNVEASRRKLAQWQLPERRLYVLKLVQWAVASHCSWLELSIDREDVQIRHDGHSVSEANIRDLLSDPLGGERSLRHFGAGLNGVFNLKPESVVLQSGGREWDLKTLQLVGDSAQPFTTLSVRGLPSQRLERSARLSTHLRKNFWRLDCEGPLQKLIWEATGIPNIESSLVKNFCHLCSVPIWVNGKPVNRPILGLPMSYRFKNVGDDLSLAATAKKGGDGILFLLRNKWTPQSLAAPPGGSFSPGGQYWVIAKDENRCEHELESPGLEPKIRDIRTTLAAGKVPKLCCEDGPYMAASAMLSFHPKVPGVSFLLLQDGVIVEELFRDTSFSGGTIAADVSELPTDLSSLSLLRNEDFTAKLAWLDGWGKYLAG